MMFLKINIYFLTICVLFCGILLSVCSGEEKEGENKEIKPPPPYKPPVYFDVTTKLGKIKGTKEKTKEGVDYFSFRGVRYSQAPVKEMRFKEPDPVLPWDGFYNASLDGPVCPQFHIETNEVIGDEDCLLLNVYTSDVENLKNVIVFIHGGGFISGTGSSELYGPEYLVAENVVLVSLQYRLGSMGFLSTDTEDATGNYAIFDIIQALYFVQAHISSFGGDPQEVSLLGEGAGAALATLLTFTPKGKGLFKNVIALGGTPISTQYFQPNPLESSRELASRLQCDYHNFKELVDCVKTADIKSVIKETNNMFSFFSFPRWFAPTIDKKIFKQFPEYILSEGSKVTKVPILAGLSKHEGAFYMPLTLNSFSDGNYDGNYVDQRFPRLLPVITEFQTKLFPLSKSLKKRYFTNIDLDSEDEFRPRYIEFLTDLLFARFTRNYAQSLSAHNIPVYFFLFDYVGTNSIMDFIGEPDAKLIAHGDILQYIFSQVLGEDKDLPKEDRDFSKNILIPFILNFAKTSNPTPGPTSLNFGDFKCPRFSSGLGDDEGTVCAIGNSLSQIQRFRSNILKFWDEEIPKIYSTQKDEL